MIFILLFFIEVFSILFYTLKTEEIAFMGIIGFGILAGGLLIASEYIQKYRVDDKNTSSKNKKHKNTNDDYEYQYDDEDDDSVMSENERRRRAEEINDTIDALRREKKKLQERPPDINYTEKENDDLQLLWKK